MQTVMHLHRNIKSLLEKFSHVSFGFGKEFVKNKMVQTYAKVAKALASQL
jgi:hypothetical protein